MASVQRRKPPLQPLLRCHGRANICCRRWPPDSIPGHRPTIIRRRARVESPHPFRHRSGNGGGDTAASKGLGNSRIPVGAIADGGAKRIERERGIAFGAAQAFVPSWLDVTPGQGDHLAAKGERLGVSANARSTPSSAPWRQPHAQHFFASAAARSQAAAALRPSLVSVVPTPRSAVFMCPPSSRDLDLRRSMMHGSTMR